MEARLKVLGERLHRARLDCGTEAVSEQDIEAYELAAENARAELDEREGRLPDVRVTAPIGGTVRIIPRTRTSAMMVTGQSAEGEFTAESADGEQASFSSKTLVVEIPRQGFDRLVERARQGG